MNRPVTKPIQPGGEAISMDVLMELQSVADEADAGTTLVANFGAARLLGKLSGLMPFEDEALCKQADPEAFILEAGGTTKYGKRICSMCVVSDECLEWALANNETGVWGGTSDNERKEIKKQRAAKED